MSHDVFISFSSKDKTTADAVCAALEHRRIRCWIAPRDVVPGRPYAESIMEGLKGAKALVLVLSSSSNVSPNVLREIENAVQLNILLIPFRIDAVQLSTVFEYYLKPVHWIDALTPPLEQHITKLVQQLGKLLSIGEEGSIGHTDGEKQAIMAKSTPPPEPPRKLAQSQYPDETIKGTHSHPTAGTTRSSSEKQCHPSDELSVEARQRVITRLRFPSVVLLTLSVLSAVLYFILMVASLLDHRVTPLDGTNLLFLAFAAGNCLIAFGAYNMRKARRYGLSRSAAALSIICPMTCLGFPFAIWSICLLLDKNVKRVFDVGPID